MSHVVYDPAARTPPDTVDLQDEPSGAAEPARPSGPAAAVVVAAGLASFTLGLLSVLSAASESVSDALTLSDRVGDVSGLSVAATIVFFACWGVLAIVWRRANPSLVKVSAVAGLLVALGLVGTFPPFFNAFGG